jgi:hypothetical protein
MYTVPACTDRICTGDSTRWTAEYGPAWRSIIAVWVAVSIPKMITLEQPTGSMRKLSISALPAATGTGTGSYIKGAPRQGLTRKGSWVAPRAVADLGPRRRSTSLLPEPQALVISDARSDELTPACTPPPAPPAAAEQLSNSFHGSAAAAIVPLYRMSSEGANSKEGVNSDKDRRKQSLDTGMRKLAAAWVRLSAEENKGKTAAVKELSRRSNKTDVAVAPEKPLAPATKTATSTTTSTATTADSTAAATLGYSERAGKHSKEPKQKKRTATVAATSPLTGVVVGGESSAPAEQLPRRLSRHGSLRQMLSSSVRSFR